MKLIKSLALSFALILSTLPVAESNAQRPRAGRRAPAREQRTPSPQRSQRDAEIERRIDALIRQMTLEEKLGQLQQLDGEANGNYRPEHPDMIRRGRLGSTLNVRGAARVNELQRIAMNESRLRIPFLFAFDVIHGYRTIFPVPLAEASSWDARLAEESAQIAAREASAAGVRWTFAPMVDIARDPRWGRIVEGAGEDPFLGAQMARARVRGFQGADYSQPDRMVACAKHFVAYGAAEAGRDYNTVDMSERRLREIYFPPFRAAIDAGVGTFMTSFNDLNGVPATSNRFILTDVLRGEWRFDGVVVSDYTAVQELIAHGQATDGRDAARLALNAGTDIEMVSRLYNQHGAGLLQSRQVSMAAIDEAVRRVLRIKFRLGLFDRPFTDETREARTLLNEEHTRAARTAAARSMVLLKNERETLPLDASRLRSIAVVGPLSDDQLNLMGSWTGDGRAQDVVPVLGGIRTRAGSRTRITHARGCDINCTSNEGFDEAVRAARESDFTVLVVGESAEMSGEAASRSSIDLPGRQLELVQAIHATGKPYVVVLMNGRPLTINWIAENSPAILEAWFGGTQAGNAIADILFGDVNPGGHLPVTFPRNVGQIPIYYSRPSTGRPPSNEKYTSKYLDVPVTPLYPFGYGLSYTTFELSNLRLSQPRIRANESVTATVEVQNTGRRAGDVVVQLYLRDVAASVVRPVRELRGFERVTLNAGERRTIRFTLTPEHLGFLDERMRFRVEPGAFQLFVGTSSVSGLEASFEVVE